ncbi:U2 snRNP complex subunit MSL1 NDAI_0A04070 [Naumovozyma dairenensis CBS 421]|uniref:RRM domain-containing protein n=1 Tax=Naumovozyma dairenensis (strain ATCC 10597 / BCRC 20456 / CBS 421 / NBRC 0211 / NRRL Y-12639) TaxID=1071378 RepID=G0W426_NAUDC|nr:hypothetical protein NDAI_0A04070 [Naumovozyma dairenensis CBS 421]CCD22564.1 hypothetical protein NDAI_0A04070 [Naumovozyma dairenensis CBS 421]
MPEPPRKKSKKNQKQTRKNIKKKAPISPRSTLYVSNLNEKINPKRLRINLYLLFSIYGEVIKVAISAKKQRGQAYITMKNVDEANLAKISLNDELFFENPLHIEFSKEDSIIR